MPYTKAMRLPNKIKNKLFENKFGNVKNAGSPGPGAR